jgi:hypothetical protein
MLDKNNRAFVNHVAGLFDPKLLNKFRDIMIEHENDQLTANITEREKHALERGESTDKFRMQEAWYDVWKHATSYSALLTALAPFIWVTYPVQVRHVRKVHHHVPWHQDIDYMRLLKERGHQQVITCFIPLEPEPAKCTTIEYAFDNIHEDPTREYPHVPVAGFGAGIVDHDFKDTKYFDLALGDALIFGDFTLHRTFLPAGCQIERRSLEFRLILPEHALPNKDYFDIQTQEFLRFNSESLNEKII